MKQTSLLAGCLMFVCLFVFVVKLSFDCVDIFRHHLQLVVTHIYFSSYSSNLASYQRFCLICLISEPEVVLCHHNNNIAQFTSRIHLYYTQSNICDDSICYMCNNAELLVCI